jgi:methyltransferase-like protein
MLAGRFPAGVAETLERISPDIVHLEQYMDFVRNRLCRQTLLCHRGLPLRRALGPAVLLGFLAASAATPGAEPRDLSDGEKRTFRTRGVASIETDAPLTVAAFALMHEHWPRAIDIDELYRLSLERAAPRVPLTEAEAHRSVLMQDLFQCYLANLIELHTWQAACVNHVSERPKASRLAAYQAGNGEHPVNQRHETVNLDPVGSELLLALDGSRDRLQLLEYLVQRAKAGALPILDNGAPIVGDDRLHEVLSPAIDETLTKLARAALLVG